MRDNDTLVNLPKSTTGISQRFIYFLISCAFIFVVMLGYLVQHAATSDKPSNVEKEAVSQLNSEAIISELKREEPEPIAIEASRASKENVITTNEATELFKAASSAPISIYQHEPLKISTVDTANHLAIPVTSVEGSNYREQNGQSEKKAFLKAQESPQKSVSSQRVKKAASNYLVSAGTIVPATLLTGINSDLPNQIIAKVRRAVYDSRTGNHLLIPQGATLIGIYDSQITYGQQRVLVAWSRIIFPNGASINLEGQPGADLAGMAGLADKVNHHRFQVFSSAVMMSLFGAAGQLAQPREQSNGLTNSQIIYGAIGQQLTQTAAQMIAKSMDVQPTITIRPGLSFNILLTRDFVFPGPYRFDA